MTWNEIASAVCICVSAIIYSISLQGKTKAKILLIQIFSGCLFVANYAFVINIIPSALIGAITAIFETLRGIIFYFIDKSEKYNTKKFNYIVSAIFLVILIACSIVAWNSWYSILPLASAIIVTLALANKNVVVIKSAFVIQAVLTITYLLLLNLWINAASQIVVLILGIVGLVTYIKKSKKQQNPQDNKTEVSQ